MFANAIEAGRAYVRVLSDTKEFTKGINKVTADLNKFAVKVGRIGAVMTGIGLAMVAAMRPAVALSMQFESEMSAVAAVTRAVGTEFNQLKSKARELGATTSFSASEAAQGMKFLGMAGFNTQQILEGIPAVLQLARAGAVDLAIAADIASDVSSAFGLSAKEIKRVADVMALAAASANVTIEGLGESFKFAAPAGKAAGQSIEEVTAALGALGSSGLKGSIAGRNLQIMFKQLARTDVQDTLRQMGVEVADAEGRFRDLSDIIRDLQGPLRKLSEVERVRVLGEVFGEAAKAAQILVTSSDGFTQLRDQLLDANGAAEQMAATMSDNLQGDFLQLKSAAEELGLAFADGVAPALRNVTQSVTSMVRSLGQFLKDHPGVSQAALNIASGLLAIGATLTGIAAVTKGLSMLIGTLKTLQIAGIASINGINVAMAAMFANPVLTGLTLIAVEIAAIGMAARDSESAVKALQDRLSVFAPGAVIPGAFAEKLRDLAKPKPTNQPSKDVPPAQVPTQNPVSFPVAPQISSELTAFAQSIKQGLMSEEQLLEQTLTQLRRAFDAGLLSLDEFNAATAQASAELQNKADQQRMEAFQAQREAKLSGIHNRLRQDLTLARAQDDLIGELKTFRKGIGELSKLGDTDAAQGFKVEEIATIAQARQSAERSYLDSLANANYGTFSRTEAVAGLGQNTVDQEMLEKMTSLELVFNQANEELARMRRSIEED